MRFKVFLSLVLLALLSGHGAHPVLAGGKTYQGKEESAHCTLWSTDRLKWPQTILGREKAECRRRAVLKRFVFHHMAPMAGTVANAHDDQFILRTRLFPRFLRPWLPVYGVVGVVQEVGAGFVDEGVGVGWRVW